MRQEVREAVEGRVLRLGLEAGAEFRVLVAVVVEEEFQVLEVEEVVDLFRLPGAVEAAVEAAEHPELGEVEEAPERWKAKPAAEAVVAVRSPVRLKVKWAAEAVEEGRWKPKAVEGAAVEEYLKPKSAVVAAEVEWSTGLRERSEYSREELAAAVAAGEHWKLK